MNVCALRKQVGGEIQLENGEAFQELLSLDLAEDELGTAQNL